MNKDSFKEMLKRLQEYYGQKKLITVGQFNQWQAKTATVPDAAIPHIERCFQDHHDQLPKNVPRYVHGYYQGWKSLNTEKTIGYEKTNCGDCSSTGFLWVLRPAMINGNRVTNLKGEMLNESTVFRCGGCENWKAHCHPEAIAAAKKADLEQQGFEFF